MTEIVKQSGYNKLDEGRGLPAYHIVSDPGYIKMSGHDRIDFLQRQTTNDLRQLTADRPMVTVLTSPTARILDVLTVLISDESTLSVLTLPGRGAHTTAFLRQRIFFNDNVTLEDVSSETALIDIFIDPDSDVSEGRSRISDILTHYNAAKLIGLEQPLASLRLILPSNDLEGIQSMLDEAGYSQMTDDDAELLRVEAGIPGANELTEDYTPLETNLRYAVADAKGCYTGQEVIARQITYDKVTRRLIGLRLDQPARPGDVVILEDRNIGVLTSAVESPRFSWIGLAVVASKHATEDTEVALQSGEKRVTARMCALPFSE